MVVCHDVKVEKVPISVVVVGSKMVAYELVHEDYYLTKLAVDHVSTDNKVHEDALDQVDCKEVSDSKVNRNIKVVSIRSGIVQIKLD